MAAQRSQQDRAGAGDQRRVRQIEYRPRPDGDEVHHRPATEPVEQTFPVAPPIAAPMPIGTSASWPSRPVCSTSAASTIIAAHSAASAGMPASAANVPCRLSMQRIDTKLTRRGRAGQRPSRQHKRLAELIGRHHQRRREHR